MRLQHPWAQHMHRRSTGSLGAIAVAIASTTASAAPAPDLVSVLVTWSEGRQQRINNAPEMRSATVNFNLGI
jgi:hypothetical protein